MTQTNNDDAAIQAGQLKKEADVFARAAKRTSSEREKLIYEGQAHELALVATCLEEGTIPAFDLSLGPKTCQRIELQLRGLKKDDGTPVFRSAPVTAWNINLALN